MNNWYWNSNTWWQQFGKKSEHLLEAWDNRGFSAFATGIPQFPFMLTWPDCLGLKQWAPRAGLCLSNPQKVPMIPRDNTFFNVGKTNTLSNVLMSLWGFVLTYQICRGDSSTTTISWPPSSALEVDISTFLIFIFWTFKKYTWRPDNHFPLVLGA